MDSRFYGRPVGTPQLDSGTIAKLGIGRGKFTDARSYHATPARDLEYVFDYRNQDHPRFLTARFFAAGREPFFFFAGLIISAQRITSSNDRGLGLISWKSPV